MKKEILIFGAVVVLCLGVTAFALMKTAKAKPTTTDLGSSGSLASHTDSGSGMGDSGSGLPGSGSPGSLGSSDTFIGNSQYPAPSGDLGKPYDPSAGLGTGTAGTSGTGGSGGVQPPNNPFPGSSTGGSGTSPGGIPLPGPTAKPLPTPPPTFTEPAPAPSSETRTHVVAKGEILSDISKKYYGSSKHWRTIAEANNVKEDGLKPGMKLTIPPLAATSAPVTPAVSDTGTADAGTYVVKKGDSYYKIAKKELGDASRFNEIQKLNGIAAEDLHEGLKLKLPAKAGAIDAAPVPAPDAPAGSRTHVVADGEYLSDISKKYYGSTKHWQEIVKANPGVSPEHLKVGQKLVIPDLGGGAAAGVATPDAAVAGDEYVVKKGDTFEVIASKVLGDKKQWTKIKEANPGVDPTALKIGQKLKLPAGAAHQEPEAIPGGIPAPVAPFSPAPGHAPAPLSPLSPLSSDAGRASPGIPGPAPAANDPWATPLPSAPAPSSPLAPSSPSSSQLSDPWALPATGTGTSTGSGIRP
jgi:nucleoid-associated protein YgaU